MDKLKQLYTLMDGRLGRRQFWMAILGLLIAGLIVSLVLNSLIVGTVADPSLLAAAGGSMTNDEFAALILSGMSKSGWINLVIFVVFLYPMAAIFIKRRHDRGKSGIEFWVYAGLTILMMLMQGLGMGFTMTEISGMNIPMPTMAYSILSLGVALLGLYLLIVAGFFKGDEGDNAFGPDPLGATIGT